MSALLLTSNEEKMLLLSDKALLRYLDNQAAQGIQEHALSANACRLAEKVRRFCPKIAKHLDELSRNFEPKGE
jgi:hypothetical protein